MRHAALLLLFTAAVAGAQPAVPGAVWLESPTLSVSLIPDSAGVRLWTSVRVSPAAKPITFGDYVAPSKVTAWISGARAFITQPPSVTESSRMIRSEILTTLDGSGIYVVRRKEGDKWQENRLLVMESLNDTVPLLLYASPDVLLQILDSLDATAKRTPFSETAAQRARADSSGERVDKPASANPGNKPPRYPDGERSANRSGRVIATFVIGVDGKADMATFTPMSATNEAFAKAVRDALPAMTFTPAERGGVKVRSLVMMPFNFSLVR